MALGHGVIMIIIIDVRVDDHRASRAQQAAPAGVPAISGGVVRSSHLLEIRWDVPPLNWDVPGQIFPWLRSSPRPGASTPARAGPAVCAKRDHGHAHAPLGERARRLNLKLKRRAISTLVTVPDNDEHGSYVTEWQIQVPDHCHATAAGPL